ncbi:MAG TPA: MFS transporter [Acidimicrobiales bacterium]|nr:MFS transporter [Acidimicrobiales bacterium]
MPRSKVLIDLSPLRQFPQFRLLWSGFFIRTIGNQLTVVAVPYQVFRLTGSSFDVGLVSTIQLGPLLVGSFLGGSIIDAVDRRRLLLCTQVLLAATSIGLALNAAHRPSVWPIFLCSAMSAGFQGVDNPASAALIVNVVDRPAIVSANALWQALFNVGQVAGPAVAGILLANVSLQFVFWIDVLSYAFSLITIVRLAPIPRPTAEGSAAVRGFPAMFEGLRHVRRHQSLQGIFISDLDAMVLGMPRALFPAMGLVRFHGGAAAVGLLYAAPGAGALLGALLTGWVSRVRRQGRAVLVCIVAWGVAVAAFGLVGNFPLALIFLGLGGAADLFSAIFRSSILQLVSPRGMLGRIQAVQTAVVTGGPRLGDLEHGAVAALTTPEISVVSGGIACVIGALALVRLLPRFDQFELGDALAITGEQVSGRSGSP